MKQATERANFLAQKILDARLALMRLRQTHPHPRLTIPMADQKLVDQVTEMQDLSDQVESVKKEVKIVKEKAKSGILEVEKLRLKQTESERAVESLQLEDDDNRLVPLYDWCAPPRTSLPVRMCLTVPRYTASLHLHRSIFDLEESHSVAENELRLTYKLEPGPTRVTIVLVFTPQTRALAGVETAGFEEMGIETDDIIETHIAANDAIGLVGLLLSRARHTLNSNL